MKEMITGLSPPESDMIFQFLHHSSQNVKREFTNLYDHTSYQQRGLYGFKLVQKQLGSHLMANQQTHKLKPVQLSLLQKMLILGFSWVYSWQPITWNNLNSLLAALPDEEEKFDEIFIYKKTLKFVKNQFSFDFNLISGQFCINRNHYFLNSFDKQGRNQDLEYRRSRHSITINQISYFFAEPVTLVESCELFVAVATCHHISIISIKRNSGRSCKIAVVNCIDMKWAAKGLYFLQKDGAVGLLERIPELLPPNQGRSSKFRFLDDKQLRFSVRFIDTNQISTGYQYARLVVQLDNVIIFSFNKNNPEEIRLSKLSSKERGQLSVLPFYFTCKQVEGQIVYRNVIEDRQNVIVVIVSGEGGKPEKIHAYSFRVFV